MTSNMDDLTSAFERVLNAHGYGFQYAVLREVQALAMSKHSYWQPWVPEFPVEVQGSGTRIDIILRHIRRPLYLICECKRANPALANWCFARATYPDEMGYLTQNFIETIHRKDTQPQSGLVRLSGSERIYQIGLEIRSDGKGDPFSKGRGEIEDAATQVCRGMNGLIDLFANRHDVFWSDDKYVGFIPAIITTARLGATDADIADADLITGQVSNINPTLCDKDWLWYSYPQSPGLKHSLPYVEPSADLRLVRFQEFVRNIAIVSPNGLAKFLGMNVWYP